jgi:hypothetical protein
MGFRFRRSIKILPGIRLNVAKRGISTSIGVRGAHVTFGRTGTRSTVGLPGTGISYSTVSKPHHEALPAPEAIPRGKAWRGWLWVVLILMVVAAFILSPRAHALT